ncbi:diguanylate cyclase [Aurantimonas sp. Leaf443]|uniref:diguanylate cyclase domain-containing protein n=1 Tax=Aurantimonas sp. Leaf443 TaxID=1736378 RepID=UPI0006F887E6|nr:diguanylate cyclase [Aurantimonas sp. Leaf443]KQT88426.1 hypothetical protein ASG48_03150 [Aurantimonas sp. Leaf443]
MRFVHVKLIGPAVAGLALVLVATATLPFYGAAQIDTAARLREETIVARNVALWIADVEIALSSWTIWDEPIAKIDNEPDLEWTERNIGRSVLGTSAHRFVAVIDGSDGLFFAMSDPSVAGRPFFARGTQAILADAWPMLESVRGRERRPQDGGIPKAVASSRMEVVGNEAVLITASLFQPDFRTAMPVGKAPILLTVMPIEGGLVGVFGDRFLLDDPRLTTGGAVAPGRASVPIARRQNGEPMLLSWQAPRPASDMVMRSLPLIVVSVLAFTLGAVLTLRISRITARTLVNREREMRQAATHDFLTGLPNRSLFEPRFGAATAKGRAAVACLDLDGFKPINDTLGHAAGDEVLCQVAQRLRAAVRAQDTVFRLGGDEFAMLMPGLADADAQAACERLVETIAAPMQLSQAEVRVSASVGVVGIPGEGWPAPVALDRADAALYRAKSGPEGSVAVAAPQALPPAAREPDANGRRGLALARRSA